jgi:hypothetical protein
LSPQAALWLNLPTLFEFMALKYKSADELLRDLFSAEPGVVQAAIDKCREKGNATFVAPLIAYYASAESSGMRDQVGEMLSTLKVTGVENTFMDALNNPAWKHIRKDLLSFMWNSAVQPVERLTEITRIALEGSYEETLEALTLLESLESTVPEEVILECITLFRQRSGNGKEKDALLREYNLILEEMRVNNDLS